MSRSECCLTVLLFSERYNGIAFFSLAFQALPEKFYDRTTRASELPESHPKNRYPDIKAYDQTRVKLTQLNGAIGTDYINANYVLGYKERKKFVCAQGKDTVTHLTV